MAGQSAGYDLSVSTFSPDGRVFQVEYATKATEKSPPIIGVVCKDGVVLGAQRTVLTPLNIAGSNPSVFAVDKHIAAVITGVVGDGRQLVLRARMEATEYRKVYGIPIPCRILSERVGLFAHNFTLMWSTRPFGACVMFVSHDDKGGELYCVEPTGTCTKYFGNSYGEGQQLSKTEIEKGDFCNKTTDEAVPAIIKILRQSTDDKTNTKHIDMGWIRKNSNTNESIFEMVPKAILESKTQEVDNQIRAMDIDS